MVSVGASFQIHSFKQYLLRKIIHVVYSKLPWCQHTNSQHVSVFISNTIIAIISHVCFQYSHIYVLICHQHSRVKNGCFLLVQSYQLVQLYVPQFPYLLFKKMFLLNKIHICGHKSLIRNERNQSHVIVFYSEILGNDNYS